MTKETVDLLLEGVRFSAELLVGWDALVYIAKDERRVFAVRSNDLKPVQVFSHVTGWMRTLCATRQGPPTTLVSGIPMHRIKDTDPLRDTDVKLRAFGQVQGHVLDTATGLGYTAIGAAAFASTVTTIEVDPAAIELARQNPWSAELFLNHKIHVKIGDAFEEICKFASSSLDGVLHDPPTPALGGELYSQEFYLRLHRSMRSRAPLFHYVGDPKSNVGRKAYPGILRRLSLAGFKQARVMEEAHGVRAFA